MIIYRRALMCAPYYYDIPAAENPHMTGKQPINKELALREWTDLVNILQHFGIKVHFMPPVSERWDMVFTANGGWAHHGRAALSNFRWPVRRGEMQHFQAAFERMGFSRETGTLRKLPDDIRWEGQGDVLEGSKEIIFHGWGIRSDRAALSYVEDFLSWDERLINLRLVDPDFYHLDTCAMPIPARNILVFYPRAFDSDSIKRLKVLQLERIELSPFLAYCFAANSPVFGDMVLLNIPFAPTDECRELSARGVLLTESGPRFRQINDLDAGDWEKDKELRRKVAASYAHPFCVEDGEEDAGYVWLIRKFWERNLKVVPVYTSQFMPSGAGARCCVMLF